MKFIWTDSASEIFYGINSMHFSVQETMEYKLHLMDRVEEKISLLKTTIPVGLHDWEGSYKIIVDRFIIYYSLSDDKKTCFIEYFKHMSQLR